MLQLNIDRVAFELGPIAIYWYAVFITTGILIAFLITLKEAQRRNIEKKSYEDMIVWGLILSIIGTRLYYVIFNFSYYSGDLLKIFNIRDGGLAIHGGIITAFVFAYFYTKRKNMPLLDVFDLTALGFMIAQAIGRWGNFFNQEAHGPKTTLDVLQSQHLPNFIIEGMNINGTYYLPTFLYESIWNLVGFIIAYFIIRKFSKNKGNIFAFYLIWYSVARFYIESLRTDSLYLGDFKIAQIVSLLMFVTGILVFVFRYFSKRRKQ